MKWLALVVLGLLVACDDPPTTPPPPDGRVLIVATVTINGKEYRDTLTVRVPPGEHVGAILELGDFECDDD